MFASYETIPHNQATGELIDKIVAIKEGPWPHGKASQVAWIERNLRPDDEHCILRVQGEIVAYVTLSRLAAHIPHSRQADGVRVPSTIMGLGCVCSSTRKRGLGWGRSLTSLVSSDIKSRGFVGLLLCRDELVGFYGSLSCWQLWGKGCVLIDGPQGVAEPVGANAMGTMPSPSSPLVIDRSF